MEPLTGEVFHLFASPTACSGAVPLTVTGYGAEARALDADILALITAWHDRGASITESRFNALALRIFAHQLRYNAPYARYCATLEITPDNLPTSWEEIPPVPVSAFKDALLTTFPCENAELHFETSGTTRARSGEHFMETAQLYRASLLAGFDRAMLDDGAKLRYLNVVPRRQEKPHSSLAYMVDVVSHERGDGHSSWYVAGEELLVDSFIQDLHSAIADVMPVCITGTALALLNLVDALSARGQRFALPPNSRVMETGGFKGRTRNIDRGEFYRLAAECFGIDELAIVAEYGMTELSSQCYDSSESRASNERIKVSAPWLRSRPVGVDGRTSDPGMLGALVHVDLANRSSVVAIATDDVGYRAGNGFVLRGRTSDAELRGCSLDAEELWSQAR